MQKSLFLFHFCVSYRKEAITQKWKYWKSGLKIIPPDILGKVPLIFDLKKDNTIHSTTPY